MKTDVSQLPVYAQNDLRKIVSLITEHLPECEMIILYGSYARGTAVRYDEKIEFGILTTFMSDYDILVVTSGRNVEEVGSILETVDALYYKRPEQQVPIQFINEDIEKLNSDLSEGRYFYTEVKRDGILLYDSGRCKLARARKLNFEEIGEQAEEYFNEKFNYADDFLDFAKYGYLNKKYRMVSFLLHQACENYFYSLRLVHTLKNSKQHNLAKLLGSTRKYSPERIRSVFPRDTKEEKRLFDLLKRAYVEARYNPKFEVTKEDIDVLTLKTQALREITYKTCIDRMEYYKKIANRNK
ncbi:MAG: HEPN domain-containing protein [Bacteroidaceae bacterium]|nr:HEPN domain-containing protein [Bacteroidaceae bacterium]